jgi:hypothetical protein
LQQFTCKISGTGRNEYAGRAPRTSISQDPREIFVQYIIAAAPFCRISHDSSVLHGFLSRASVHHHSTISASKILCAMHGFRRRASGASRTRVPPREGTREWALRHVCRRSIAATRAKCVTLCIIAAQLSPRNAVRGGPSRRPPKRGTRGPRATCAGGALQQRTCKISGHDILCSTRVFAPPRVRGPVLHVQEEHGSNACHMFVHHRSTTLPAFAKIRVPRTSRTCNISSTAHSPFRARGGAGGNVACRNFTYRTSTQDEHHAHPPRRTQPCPHENHVHCS